MNMNIVNSTQEPNLSEKQRYLNFYWAPVIVVGIGSILVLISMFLPHLSSYEVLQIENNLMIQNEPLYILCAIGGIISIFRYWSVGSKSSANTAIWVGIWFLGWSIYDSYNGQLINLYTKIPITTNAAAGLWASGVGSAIIALGGLMMRFPHSSFGLIVGQTISKDEINQIASSTKICPKCAETVKSAALICRYCGHQFINADKKDDYWEDNNMYNEIELTIEEQKQVDAFVKFGIKQGERLVINKTTRKIDRFDDKEWVKVNQSEWIIIFEN